MLNCLSPGLMLSYAKHRATTNWACSDQIDIDFLIHLPQSQITNVFLKMLDYYFNNCSFSQFAKHLLLAAISLQWAYIVMRFVAMGKE